MINYLVGQNINCKWFAFHVPTRYQINHLATYSDRYYIKFNADSRATSQAYICGNMCEPLELCR